MFQGFRWKRHNTMAGSPVCLHGDDAMTRNIRCSEAQPVTGAEDVSEVVADTRHERGQVLAGMPIGCRCKIRGHKSCGAIRQRLLDLGFVPNAEVEVVRAATLGDPLEMRLGNYYVALRKREAELIEVQEAV